MTNTLARQVLQVLGVHKVVWTNILIQLLQLDSCQQT